MLGLGKKAVGEHETMENSLVSQLMERYNFDTGDTAL
jgi:hypothetical protein